MIGILSASELFYIDLFNKGFFPSLRAGVSWLPNLINESLLFYLEMQPNIQAADLRNIRNASLITWFIMVSQKHPLS